MHDILKAGLDFVLNIRNPDGGWGAKEGFSSDVASIYYVIPLLSLYSNYSQFVQNGCKWLLDCQNSDFGWGLYPNQKSRVYTTASALSTLKKTGNISNNNLFKIQKYLSDNQNEDGGWPFEKGKDSSIHATKHVLRAMYITNANHSIVSKGIKWLILQKTSQGAWGISATEPDIHMTTGVLALLSSINRRENLCLIDQGIKWVKDQQKSDGSWKFSEFSIDFTGSAIYYLLSAGVPYDDSCIKKAIHYVIHSRNLYGGWSYLHEKDSSINPTCTILMGIDKLINYKKK